MPRQPNAKLDRVTDATVEPLTLADAKNFLRVEISDDDATISQMITAARWEAETFCNRSFVETTWKLTLDYFPPFASNYINTNILPALQFGVAAVGGKSIWINMEAGAIVLPMPPLIAVSSINYVDISGNSQTLSSSTVIVSTGTPGQIAPVFGTIFPITRPQLSAVQIAYTAGFSADASLVPPPVILAMKFLVASYYENRTVDVPMPKACERLLRNVQWGSY